MKLTRLAALIAVPAAFSLAACGGGSSGVLGNTIGTGGQQGNIRFVNGSPDLGSNIDIYLQATGAAQPSAPAAPSTTNMPYGEASLFFAEPTVAYTAIVRSAGAAAGSTALLGLACPIPQLSANAKYTVVISGTNATGHTCRLFQDFDYGNTPPQYRVHDAASTLGNSVAYGTTTVGTPAPYNPANTALLGTSALASSASFTQVQPAGPIPNAATNPIFQIGQPNGAAIAANNGIDAKSLFASGSLTQPDTSGSLNFPSTAGTSLFAIDCTAASVAAFPGIGCNNGVALIGTFDTL